MSAVTNISTYGFAELTGLKELRDELIGDCKSWELKGTILLSSEGLKRKISVSEKQPFNRILVRIQKEIISFGMESIMISVR